MTCDVIMYDLEVMSLNPGQVQLGVHIVLLLKPYLNQSISLGHTTNVLMVKVWICFVVTSTSVHEASIITAQNHVIPVEIRVYKE